MQGVLEPRDRSWSDRLISLLEHTATLRGQKERIRETRSQFGMLRGKVCTFHVFLFAQYLLMLMQPPYMLLRHMNPFTMIPMPPGHTEDLGRSRYLGAWTIEKMTKGAIVQFDHCVKLVFSHRGNNICIIVTFGTDFT